MGTKGSFRLFSKTITKYYCDKCKEETLTGHLFNVSLYPYENYHDDTRPIREQISLLLCESCYNPIIKEIKEILK